MPSLVKGLVKGVQKVAKSAVREGAPPAMRKLLEKYGDWQISNIMVGRTPLPSVIQKIASLLTLGAVDEKIKELGYDNMYHLFMIITIDNGQSKKLKFEKNQVVNLTESLGLAPEESRNVSVSKNLTLSEFIENGKRLQGSAYWTYDVRTNNCQKFVIANLMANHLLHVDVRDFVDQNAKELIGPFLGEITNVVTDAAASFDKFQNGSGNITYMNNQAFKRKLINI